MSSHVLNVSIVTKLFFKKIKQIKNISTTTTKITNEFSFKKSVTIKVCLV